MEERVRKTEKYRFLMNHDVSTRDEQVITGVKALNKTTGETFEIPAAGFFRCRGHKPNTDVAVLLLGETGYIVNTHQVLHLQMLEGFVAGDAADHVYRQAITAAGTGCIAALDAERYLAARE
jgi:thioredoxin reductase (NADPH)